MHLTTERIHRTSFGHCASAIPVHTRSCSVSFAHFWKRFPSGEGSETDQAASVPRCHWSLHDSQKRLNQGHFTHIRSCHLAT